MLFRQAEEVTSRESGFETPRSHGQMSLPQRFLTLFTIFFDSVSVMWRMKSKDRCA